MKKTAALLLALLPLASMAQKELEIKNSSELPDLSDKKAEYAFENRTGGECINKHSWFDAWCEYSSWMDEVKYEVSASSTLPQQGSNKYFPNLAADGDLSTAWVEGVKGDGKGEKLKFKFEASTHTISNILIYTGYVKSPAAYYNNARPKKLRVYVDGKATYDLKIQDIYGEQTFELPEVIKIGEGKTIEFEIMEVYPGKKWQDCAITDIVFYTWDELEF